MVHLNSKCHTVLYVAHPVCARATGIDHTLKFHLPDPPYTSPLISEIELINPDHAGQQQLTWNSGWHILVCPFVPVIPHRVAEQPEEESSDQEDQPKMAKDSATPVNTWFQRRGGNKNSLCSKTCGIDKIFKYKQNPLNSEARDTTPKRNFGWDMKGGKYTKREKRLIRTSPLHNNNNNIKKNSHHSRT